MCRERIVAKCCNDEHVILSVLCFSHLFLEEKTAIAITYAGVFTIFEIRKLCSRNIFHARIYFIEYILILRTTVCGNRPSAKTKDTHSNTFFGVDLLFVSKCPPDTT